MSIDIRHYKRFKRPTLVEEIKNILQKYPDDGQIFKEIIQNAEDAGASEVAFIYDENDHTSGGHKAFSNPNLSKFQGPALYAYNNAMFTATDWDGIRSLGISNKRTDPLKVGRFGLGFKSVFHLTDLPSIVSGKILAYLDPMVETFNDELEFLNFNLPEDKNKFHNYSDFEVLKNLPGQFSLDGSGNCNGTLFRFPLRRQSSVISNVCYDGRQMAGLIETFKRDGHLNVLFLKKVKSIKLYKIKSNKVLEEIYAVEVSQKQYQDYSKRKSQFLESIVENVMAKRFDTSTINHFLELQVRSQGVHSYHTYVISEHFGYSQKDSFFDMIRDPDLSYIPLVAVALPVVGDDPGGHIFCGLPLPMREKCMTGLPVHVNGFFALGPDRKDLKWKTISANESNDKSVNWNECLIQKLLPVVYCNLIKFLVENDLGSNLVYQTWPQQEIVNSKWKMFLHQLYEYLSTSSCIFITCKNKWIMPSEVLFIDEKDFKSKMQCSAITKLLETLGMNISQAPSHVLETLQCFVNKVSKATVKTSVSNNPLVYSRMSSEKKCLILSFVIQCVQDLQPFIGFQLVPLIKNGFGVLQYSYSCANQIFYMPTVYHSKELLPSFTNVLDATFFAYDACLLKVFEKAAQSGQFNMKLMNSWEVVLDAVKKNMPSDWAVSTTIVNWPDSSQYPSRDWLTLIWLYMRSQRIPFSKMFSIPLIPIEKEQNRMISKLSESSMLMLNAYSKNRISLGSEMKTILSKIGIRFVDESSIDVSFVQDLYYNKFILLPDGNGIIDAFVNTDILYGSSGIMSAIDGSSVKARDMVLKYICNYPNALPSFVVNLNLFKAFRNGNVYTSSSNGILVDECIVPKEFDTARCNLVSRQAISSAIQNKFGFNVWGFEEIITHMLNYVNALSRKQQDSLFSFIIEHISVANISNELTRRLQDCIYVTSQGQRLKPCNLFLNDKRLKNFFVGESNKFPDGCFDVRALMKLGLKTSTRNITLSDVETSIRNIGNIASSEIISKDQLRVKIKTILEVSNEQGIKLARYSSLKWMLVEISPPSNYPKSLLWFGKHNGGKTEKRLESPNAVFLPKHALLTGSVSSVVDSTIADFVQILGLSSYPTTNVVIQHLKKVVQSYNDDEKGAYKEAVFSIYKYLNICDPDIVATQIQQENVKIWTGNMFVEFGKIILRSLEINLSPYYYNSSADVTTCLQKVLLKLGCDSKSEVNIYMDVLSKIHAKHETSPQDSVQDLDLALHLVTVLSNYNISDPEKVEIYVPVDCNTLRLCKLKDCSYHDFDKDTAYSSISTYNVLHRSISEEVAQRFGVPNLVSQLLCSEESSIFEAWGQHEALTLRLNRLLHDYKDGLPISKELIQNADDAGATEVHFLYDERENENLKSRLFDRRMKDWQGPSLFVYNNKMFTEEDFENITKLNAGTKENDATKIGKFGLGFNAVYHLTDVPSFVSGESMVIFDPHMKYLGKALRTNMPGIRVRFHKRKVDFSKFNDQFKVFDGVFGVQLDYDKKGVERFDGTLFRFPLRNSKTAEESKINKFDYTDSEMKVLLKQLEKSFDHLLLFTENVKVVKVFHLSKHATHPSEMKALFSVQKHVNTTSKSLVLASNNELRQILSNPFYQIPASTKFFQNVDMVVTSQTGSSNNKWLISSVLGSQQSFQFARNNKGLNPCGGVAIPYEELKNETKIICETENRHMFCFLPLPINTHLPVNVNGTFLVSSNRKQLFKITDDEKYYGVTIDWNDLLGKDIGQAYFNLLLELKSMCPKISLEAWLGVFPVLPLPAENSCLLELIKSLFENMFLSNEEVIPAYDKTQAAKWVKWKDIVLLAPSISGLSPAIFYMNWFFKKQNTPKVCVNLPKKFISLLQKLGFNNVLSNCIVEEEEFYSKFFQYINDCELDIEIRNKILHFILQKQLSSGYLKDLLVNEDCIPTKPNGILRKPSDLVKEGSKVATLFCINDECFPNESFSQHTVYLESLGMSYHSLSWERLLDRAKSIERLQKTSESSALSRSHRLLQFIKECCYICPPEVKSLLLKTSFLAVCKKPKKLILTKWCGDGKVFSSPDQMLSYKLANIAGCSCLISEKQVDEEVNQFLNLDRDLPFVIVQEQLNEIIAEYKSIGHGDSRFREILHDIYNYLQKFRNTTEIKTLTNKNVIYTDENNLMKPCQVFEHLEQEIPGYLHRLPSTLKYRYMPILSEIGVKKDCSSTDYISVLQNIKETFMDLPLTVDLINPILHSVVPALCLKSSKLHGDIFLPDKTCVMREVKKMAFKDAAWFPDQKGIIYVHDQIPMSFCQSLQIKSLRHLHMSNQSIGLPFGQHEKLTTRINNLLKGYSEKGDVLKEILQNADDAGATEVKFILDMRIHNDEKVFSDKWKVLQGPALLISNNEKFTKRDLEAIQELGEGSKSKDALKTGKYGVGFNAVYHITDCPSFLTNIEDQGDVLCVFDPNLSYVDTATTEKPGTMWEDARKKLENCYTDVKSAYLLDELDTTQKTLFRLPLRTKDMASKSKLPNGKPTSTNDIKEMLKLLQDKAPAIMVFLNNIKSLSFSVFEKDASTMSNEHTYIAEPHGVSNKKLKNFRRFQQSFNEKLGNVSSVMNFTGQLTYSVCVQHRFNKQLDHAYHWSVVEQCGFSDMTELDDLIRDIIDKNELCLLPKGAVACLKSDTDCEKCEDIERTKPDNDKNNYNVISKNGVHCCLPIPIKSGLPVLVNGHFVLDYETRRNLWSSDKETVQVLWNYATLKNCILPCYVTYLTKLSEELSGVIDQETCIQQKIRQFYALFPNAVGKEKYSYWDYLGKCFYEHLSSYDLKLLAVCNMVDKFVSFSSPATFLPYIPPDQNTTFTYNTQKNKKTVLLEMLQKAHVDVDLLPPEIVDRFKLSKCPLTVMTPAVVRERLVCLSDRILPGGREREISKTVFKEIKNAVTVLNYCIKGKKKKKTDGNKKDMHAKEKNGNILLNTLCVFKEEKTTESKVDGTSEEEEVTLEGLPLCILADKKMTVFSMNNSKYFSKFSKLLKGKENMFLNISIWESLKSKFQCMELDCFKEFSLDEFAKLLPDVLPASIYLNNRTPIKIEDSNHVTVDWLCSFWEYLSTQTDGDGKLCLDQVNNWSLLLVKQKDNVFLLPISEAKSVLNLTVNRHVNLIEALRSRLNVFEAADYVKNLSNGEEKKSKEDTVAALRRVDIYLKNDKDVIFGSLDNMDNIVDSLLFSVKNGGYQSVSDTDALRILTHISGLIGKSDRCSDLKSLPFFEQINGNVLPVRETAVILPSGVPTIGLDAIQLQHSSVFLKEKESLSKFYKYLGFQCLESSCFYIKYVFPFIHLLSNDHIFEHMAYLRMLIICEDKLLLEELSKLKFIKTDDGYKSCKELYDPRKQLFKLMLKDINFPPEIYQTDDWLLFLRKVGLIKDVTRELFIKLAVMVSNNNFKGENIYNTSSLLCHELFQNEALTEPTFLKEIKNIRFLVSQPMSDELERIKPSINSREVMMCFNGSCTPTYKNLVWTTMPILPDYIHSSHARAQYFIPNPTNWNHLSMCLGIKTNIDFCKQYPSTTIESTMVFQHINNICNVEMALKSTTCKVMNKDDKYTLVRVLKHFYDYLKISQIKDFSYCQSLSCILVNNNNMLEVPQKATFSEEGSLLPYLNLVSVQLGTYFNLFEKMGCSTKPNAFHYAKVLEELKNNVGDKLLDPNTVKIANKAVCYLSHALKTTIDYSLSAINTLYLPTVTFKCKDVHLQISSETIHVDDFHMEGRLKHFVEALLPPSYGVKDEHKTANNMLIAHLPMAMKPKILSETVEEVLVVSDGCTDVGEDHFSQQIKKRLTSQLFLHSIKRLIRHEAKLTGNKDPKALCLDNTIQRLKEIKVFVLNSIETQLKYKDKVIENSKSEKPMFLQIENGNLQLYFSVRSVESQEVYSGIGVGLLKLFKGMLQESYTVIILPLLLMSPVEKLSLLLDKKGISRDVSESSFLDYDQLPNPGDLVQLELYGLLKNDLVDFDIDEYIALEKGNGKEVCYVYAIIRGCDGNPVKCQQTYTVQTTPDKNMLETIMAYKLYRFDQDYTVVPNVQNSANDNDGNSSVAIREPYAGRDRKDNRSYNEIINDIKKILQEVSNLPKEGKGRVIRRLYLQWHPDKHPNETKELATRVFQFLQNELRVKDEGFEENFEEWNSSAAQDSQYRRRYYDGFSNGHGRWNNRRTPPTFNKKNPQPAEARRWFRQAQCDLSAAGNDEEDAFMWGCFKAHQASAKALKAAKYLDDYQKNDSQNLVTISSGLSRSLNALAFQLESLVGSVSRMSNPDAWNIPDIPNDHYDKNKMMTAVDLAQQILDSVECLIFDKST